jgi:branched-subunit amino acid transport protein
MLDNILPVLTILGMALVVYATRVSGPWLLGRWLDARPVRTWLGYLPGTVLVALVAPLVFASGVAEALASLVTLLVAIRTRNVLISMLVGVVVVWGLRFWFT